MLKSFVLFFLLFCTLLTLSVNKHIRRDIFTYKSEIWGDKAGYYIYLPALFEYNFDAQKMPAAIEANTGNGFILNGHTIITKYPAGEAIMIAPFWLINKLVNPSDSPFDKSYHYTIDVAAAFYTALGLLLSFIIFKKYTSIPYASLLCAAMLLSTNLLYYSIDETGMSHAYSFILFTALLFIGINLTDYLSLKPIKTLISLGLLGGMIFLVRHVNILFFIPVLLVTQNSLSEVRITAKKIFFSKISTIMYCIMFLIVLPQLFYYYYINSTVSATPYYGEGFFYVFSPKILEVLFAPENGVFIYSPFLLVVLLWNISSYSFKKPIIFMPYLLFFSVIYLYASWSSYELGCGLGHRSLVEFYPFLFLPLANRLNKQKISIIFVLLFTLCSFYTLKMMYSFDGCFGSLDWDWQQYYRHLISPVK